MTQTTSTSSVGAALDAERESDAVLPLVEETAEIAKRTVETGRVRVSTQTDTFERLLSETLRSEAVDVRREPVGRELAPGEAPPVQRVEGDVTIIPILEEVLFVEKRLVLTEELHIRRTSRDDAVDVPVTLRRQRAVIERVRSDQPEDDQPA